MSTASAQTNGQFLSDTNTDGLDDERWLKSLSFRRAGNTKLLSAVEQGNVQEMSTLLGKPDGLVFSLKKRERTALLKQIHTLLEQPPADTPAFELSKALFDADLTKGELSAHIDAFIAEQPEETPDYLTLTLALWTLAVHRARLGWETRLSLWRWTLQRSQAWMADHPTCDPEQGFSQLRLLEVCYLTAGLYPELKGSRKLLKETTALIRNAIDEATDTDGTPQPHWLPSLVDSLCTLGRLTRFAELSGQKLWNKTFQKRVEDLLHRAVSFCTPRQISFGPNSQDNFARQLEQVAVTLGGDGAKGVRRLLQFYADGATPPKKLSTWELPEETHQSDWAMLGCLRSGWASPVDLSVVTFAGHIPEVDVVVADEPLFRGLWRSAIRVNDQAVESKEGWTCTCWFADDEVAYLELQQTIDAMTKTLRQVILNRQEHLLVVNHIVHAEDANEINFRATLPFHGNWTAERDTSTRECILNANAQQVRVYPLSLPQDRVHRADGELNVSSDMLAIEQKISGNRLLASTVFDWSPQRMNRPADWTRLTVAQNGVIEKLDQAAAYRLRVGREQWLLYHSLAEPDIPRTVLGLHTLHETVFSRFTSKGALDPLVEVEV